MLKNTYKDQVAFPITTAKKDVGHIRQLAADSGAKLPITEAFLHNADTVLAKHGDYDLSSVVCGNFFLSGVRREVVLLMITLYVLISIRAYF